MKNPPGARRRACPEPVNGETQSNHSRLSLAASRTPQSLPALPAMPPTHALPALLPLTSSPTFAIPGPASPLPSIRQPLATSPASSRRLQPGPGSTQQAQPTPAFLVNLSNHTRSHPHPELAIPPTSAPAQSRSARLVAIHHPLATCPRILYSICVSLATGFPMLVACSAPILSPAPAATHGQPVESPPVLQASLARRPSESGATPSNHAPNRQAEHVQPTYPRALDQPPKIRQSSRPGSPSPLWGLGLPGREYPHKPPPHARKTPATTHLPFPRPPRARPRPAEGACPELAEGESTPRTSPPNPAKMHPAAPQEFFGKNSYCARGTPATPHPRRVG